MKAQPAWESLADIMTAVPARGVVIASTDERSLRLIPESHWHISGAAERNPLLRKSAALSCFPILVAPRQPACITDSPSRAARGMLTSPIAAGITP